MQVLSVHSLIAAGLFLAAGCVCLYLGEDVAGASLVSFAIGLFGKSPVGLK
jgi:hypothetical protein